MTSLAATRDVYLVQLDDEHIDKLIETSPYYSKNVIPADTYNMKEDATTVAVGAVIIARDDVAEDDIYNVVSGIFDSIDTLGHDKKNELDPEFAASVTAVPYHPALPNISRRRALRFRQNNSGYGNPSVTLM